MKKTYVITRTGRNCSPVKLELDDGRKLTIPSRGPTIRELSASEVARARALPRLALRESTSVSVPAPVPTAPPPAPALPKKDEELPEKKAEGLPEKSKPKKSTKK